MSNPLLGQILPDSEFGRLLTALARKAETIVEIGTWHGEGSTRCLARGLVRPSQQLIAIESHEPMWQEAKARYNDKRITFLHGTLTPLLDGEGKLVAGDETPVVLDQMPSTIDLLLIDGGEDNGQADFEALWQRCKVIALDDTAESCRKGRVARRRLLEAGWKVIADRQDDRNGWAVFERP